MQSFVNPIPPLADKYCLSVTTRSASW